MMTDSICFYLTELCLLVTTLLLLEWCFVKQCPRCINFFPFNVTRNLFVEMGELVTVFQAFIIIIIIVVREWYLLYV